MEIQDALCGERPNMRRKQEESIESVSKVDALGGDGVFYFGGGVNRRFVGVLFGVWYNMTEIGLKGVCDGKFAPVCDIGG